MSTSHMPKVSLTRDVIWLLSLTKFILKMPLILNDIANHRLRKRAGYVSISLQETVLNYCRMFNEIICRNLR
jgi:hypothetical protein